ncbi:Prolyl 3-hydroxylase 1 [Chionoecetes opilio]|uniref:procollagen-proline 3-dioxygenase n=1 Tax=Chionoecetes opilio TaxID=41210 RepID=A0A8J4YH73_CHIOP|nr:Prolyl 3-hydroxylase 1 [Chionoecetes opilio]
MKPTSVARNVSMRSAALPVFRIGTSLGRMLRFTKYSLVLWIAIASCGGAETEAESGRSYVAYDFYYNEGVAMYLQEGWETCVKNLEMALKGWHWWHDNTASCRRNCSLEAEQKELLSANMSEEDRYFERALYSTHCLVRCKKNALGPQRDRVVESNVISEFNNRKPYDYLQLCYYRLGRVKDAANAAATVLAVQPNNTVMSNNLKFYMEQAGIKAADVVNLELKPYGQEYFKATLAYQDNNFGLTITLMEKSLRLFLEEYQTCRFLCENPFDQGWYPDFISSVANHFTFTLRCKRKCMWQLSELSGEVDDDFLPSFFDYLQYSYFQKEETAKACEAVATYLILKPGAEIQTHNKEFYLALDEVNEDMFVPRKEFVAFKEREDYEEELMEFIETNFAFLTDEFWDEEDDELKRLSGLGIRVVKAARKAEEGVDRVVADGLASTLECLVLTELTRLAAVEGDGYKGDFSPHTPSETFQGITLGRAGLMIHAGLIDKAALELILRVTDRCRDYVERHFHLPRQLYFAYTHLVCRTARPVHQVHVDNCILQDSGECLRVPPAYTYRDYSAILYLNEDFEGGELIFTRDRSGLTHELKVEPRCGRLVGFSSGPENPHGVLPVVEGTRCAVGLWFTQDRRHSEVERTMATLFLKKLNKDEL